VATRLDATTDNQPGTARPAGVGITGDLGHGRDVLGVLTWIDDPHRQARVESLEFDDQVGDGRDAGAHRTTSPTTKDMVRFTVGTPYKVSVEEPVAVSSGGRFRFWVFVPLVIISSIGFRVHPCLLPVLPTDDTLQASRPGCGIVGSSRSCSTPTRPAWPNDTPVTSRWASEATESYGQSEQAQEGSKSGTRS
jgi:hypothetical protein